MGQTAIKAEGLSKLYQIGHNKSSNIRETLSNVFSSSRSKMEIEDFWALKDIGFELNKGEALGIIGRNGAGKSTLLKILSRITFPTSGRFELDGRVSSLLEVGTGFHPELTGRENIFLNGTILGMRKKEIRSNFDEIVDFSGVSKFIDTPVKRYSTGMFVRLAFSVAAHLDPEILIIDEVLAVGDAEFQKKCLGKMEGVTKQGRTVIFVSHNLAAVKNLCNKSIVLKGGEKIFDGSVEEGVNHYYGSFTENVGGDLSKRADRTGSGKIKFTSFEFFDEKGTQVLDFQTGGPAILKFNFDSKEPSDHLVARVEVLNSAGALQFICNNYQSNAPFSKTSNHGSVICEIPKLPLNPGTYSFNIELLDNFFSADKIDNAGSFKVERGDFFGTGKLPAIKEGVLVEHHWKIE